jgi:hypothetical protein
VQKHFDTILEFTKIKEGCLFCQAPLRTVLTNFINPRKARIPVINAPLQDEKFIFDINHTTATYSIEAKGTIDIKENILSFEITNPSETLNIDMLLAKKVFIDFHPHVELYCANKKCEVKYNLCSDVFAVEHVKDTDEARWKILPIIFYLECFKTSTINVQNDQYWKKTFIYSVSNEDAEPITIPMLDFEKMGPSKLLTRVQTYTVWS